MALLDILTGQSGASQGPQSRVPPLARALAELLAYKQARGQAGGQASGSAPGPGPSVSDRVEDFFKPSPTGGPTAKGVIGALLTGGLMDVVQQFRGAGRSGEVDSWVASGANKPVSPADLSQVLSEDQIAFLMQRTGMSREELLAGLSHRLPKVVDELTPDGRLPTTEELTRRI